ncbi:MAG: pilus assembly protein [Parvularculaceae bacterium]|nr:pilus assembly protein [Parvularculaceae bacterium]
MTGEQAVWKEAGMSFPSDRGGNVVVFFAVLAPLLFGAAGLAIDFQARLAQRAALQDAADTLALRGARELLLENASEKTIEAMLQATAAKQFKPSLGAFAMAPRVNKADGEVVVEITQPSRASFFLSNSVTRKGPVSTQSTAIAHGVTNVCVVALEEKSSDAIKAGVDSRLDARDCAILSNSTSTSGVNVSGMSRITARFICSAGGAAGASMSFSPAPLLDCPRYDDPLAERVAPDTAGCDFVDTKITLASKSGRTGGGAIVSTVTALIDGSIAGTLQGYARYDIEPGVYCGGLEIKGLADVHAAPGVYIMKDGPLRVDAGARLYGRNVGFFLEGDNSVFDFRINSIINLTAPKTGLMAGLLFWESAAATPNRLHTISSDNARELLGTFYLPRGVLNVNTVQPLADTSAYTAIIARKLNLNGRPQLVLNADYDATDIPTPDGVGPTGGSVYLRD